MGVFVCLPDVEIFRAIDRSTKYWHSWRRARYHNRLVICQQADLASTAIIRHDENFCITVWHLLMGSTASTSQAQKLHRTNSAITRSFQANLQRHPAWTIHGRFAPSQASGFCQPSPSPLHCFFWYIGLTTSIAALKGWHSACGELRHSSPFVSPTNVNGGKTKQLVFITEIFLSLGQRSNFVPIFGSLLSILN